MRASLYLGHGYVAVAVVVGERREKGMESDEPWDAVGGTGLMLVQRLRSRGRRRRRVAVLLRATCLCSTGGGHGRLLLLPCAIPLMMQRRMMVKRTVRG